MAAAVLLVAITAGACSHESVPAHSGDRLEIGVTYTADLDGDSAVEQVRIDGGSASLVISDGDVAYRSRDKWRVVQACLGDTDRNGLVEVVALLDADDGRHLGLFAYFGGDYRERLVTRELIPHPISLQVLPGGLVELTGDPPAGQSGPRVTTYRWNGFGFTAIENTTAP